MKINQRLVNKIVLNIERISGEAIFTKSRRENSVMTRAYFCWVLKERYGSNDREISDIFNNKGVNYDRSSIYTSISKFDIYMSNYLFMRNLHSDFCSATRDKKVELLDLIYDSIQLPEEDFLNKIRESIIVPAKVIKQQPVSDNVLKVSNMLEGLTYEQELDVLETLNIKVRAYSWKNKDSTKVFVGGGTVDAF
jgi:predicted DNA-binding protein YlxM (UPF0122 family)